MPIYIGGNELNNLAIGANELDKAYAGTSLLYEKINPIASVPRRVKLMTDWAKEEWSNHYGNFNYYFVMWVDPTFRPNARNSFYLFVSNTENTIVTYPNVGSTSNTVSGIGSTSASYTLQNGWSFGSWAPIQNMTAYFPTDLYNAEILVPASGMALKLNDTVISREADFTTLEPVPLPSYFPNVNLDTIFNTYYTAPTKWYTDMMGIVDDNTVGFVRAFWSGCGEASFGCSMSMDDDWVYYNTLYTTYYHSSSANHREFIFKLDRTTGTVLSHDVPYSYSTGRHYLENYIQFKRTRGVAEESINLYTNIMGYPEMSSSNEFIVT